MTQNTTMTDKPADKPSDQPFWRTKTLEQMNPQEWESLCDGCGRCCLNKLEEEDTGTIFYTDVGCRLFDEGTCRCKDYENRQAIVEDCLQLTPQVVPHTPWLPPTCGYRLVAEGKDLYWWHPLVSGDPDTVHAAGVSVRGKMSGTEETISDDQMEDHLVDWPMEVPEAGKRK
jgi:uncharacterized cysteine cluster protein YcgN (CxxCxxCC family)